jgi:tellurite resistance protein TehA-like permease
MGTGVVSGLASIFPFGAGSLALKIVTLIFFFLNLIIFVVLSTLTLARYWMFPYVSIFTLQTKGLTFIISQVWSKMLRHPAQSVFVGCFPMGAATLINSALVRLPTLKFVVLTHGGASRFAISNLGFPT